MSQRGPWNSNASPPTGVENNGHDGATYFPEPLPICQIVFQTGPSMTTAPYLHVINEPQHLEIILECLQGLTLMDRPLVPCSGCEHDSVPETSIASHQLQVPLGPAPTQAIQSHQTSGPANVQANYFASQRLQDVQYAQEPRGQRYLAPNRRSQQPPLESSENKHDRTERKRGRGMTPMWRKR
ncbi:hypothetical protein MRB53_039869 [Persea americana]|nr:hypothetical protein MRB53_039869 [Persea americana]